MAAGSGLVNPGSPSWASTSISNKVSLPRQIVIFPRNSPIGQRRVVRGCGTTATHLDAIAQAIVFPLGIGVKGGQIARFVNAGLNPMVVGPPPRWRVFWLARGNSVVVVVDVVVAGVVVVVVVVVAGVVVVVVVAAVVASVVDTDTVVVADTVLVGVVVMMAVVVAATVVVEVVVVLSTAGGGGGRAVF
eukprot:scaffold28921_cov191-Amphora_coffeaeformis.AAC.1